MTAPVYGLTPAQADCARVIAAMTDFDGRSPSYAEIAAELCLHSVDGVHRMVHALIERGWITTRNPEQAVRKWLVVYPRRILPVPRPRRALRLTRSPPPFDYSAIAITEAGRAYLEKSRMTNPIARFLLKWLLWVFEADREPEAFGDVPHVPDKAKRRAA